MRARIIGLAAAFGALVFGPTPQAFAQPAVAKAPHRAANIRGKVKSLVGDKLTVATREGGTAVVILPAAWGVATMTPVAMDAIKPGSFIGTTEVQTGEGSGKSLEVHVFPPGVKIGEGHYPWDLKAGSMMTNGTVGQAVTGVKGREIEVSYPGGSRHILVPPGAPVVTIGAGARALIKPGVSVFIAPTRTADGSLTADRVLVGSNGAAPPM